MNLFETKVIKQGELGNGRYFYDFFDIFGKSWRIITNHNPKDTKRIGFITGNLTEATTELRGSNNYLPKLSIFLGALVKGKIEIGDIKIKKEH